MCSVVKYCFLLITPFISKFGAKGQFFVITCEKSLIFEKSFFVHSSVNMHISRKRTILCGQQRKGQLLVIPCENQFFL